MSAPVPAPRPKPSPAIHCPTMRRALRPTLVFLACFLLLGFGSAWLWGERTVTDLLIILPLSALFASLLFGAACASLMREQPRSEDSKRADGPR